MALLESKVDVETGDSSDQIINQRSQQEDEAQQEREREKERLAIDAELHPKRRFLHKMFVFVSFIAGMSALNMGIGQFIGIVYEKVDAIQYVLRLYVIVLCFLVVINELEWTKFTRESKILNNWITRGAFYSFVGILGLVENEASPADEKDSVAGKEMALTYLKVVAWLMVGVGILYSCMGFLCLQIVCNRMRDNYKLRKEIAQEKRRGGGSSVGRGGRGIQA